MLHLFSHAVDNLIICSGYPLACRIDLILFSSDVNLFDKQMLRARLVRVRIELVLRFCGLKVLRCIH